jgi:hypothetical protein
MLRDTPVRALALAIAAFLATVFALPGSAFAGTLQVRDESHVLTPEAVSHLRSIVASAPFDARLAFTSEYAEPEELSRYVGSLIHEPNMIAVGVDPQHRHVQIHYGTGSGIARSEWATIDHAGSPSFHDGRWEDGTAAIFKAAEHSVGTAPMGEPPVVPVPQAAPPSRIGSGLVIFLIVIAAVAAFAFFGRRRSSYGRYGSGYGPGYGPPPGPGYGGGYGGPGYGPPPGQGMGPVGGGLIGAGLGGIAGYELGKMEGEREERDHDRVVEERSAPDDNFDAGGGGDSWGDDNSGGGGFDGGGGGDSGGGSDF